MKRRRVLIVMVVVFVVAVLAVVLWPAEREPVYEGRKLSEWAVHEELSPVSDMRWDPPELSVAIKAMGTNSLPFFVKWISYEPSRRRKSALSLAKHVPDSLGGTKLYALVEGNGERRAYVAALGFRTLGSDAAPATPRLFALMMSTNTNPKIAIRALYALGAIGPAGIPSLVAVITNAALPGSYRAQAINCLTLGNRAGTEQKVAAVPAIRCALSDPDLKVRMTATNGLFFLATEKLRDRATEHKGEWISQLVNWWINGMDTELEPPSANPKSVRAGRQTPSPASASESDH